MLLIKEMPTSSTVVAFYAYISESLPANVATPHHVLIPQGLCLVRTIYFTFSIFIDGENIVKKWVPQRNYNKGGRHHGYCLASSAYFSFKTLN